MNYPCILECALTQTTVKGTVALAEERAGESSTNIINCYAQEKTEKDSASYCKEKVFRRIFINDV